MRYSTSTLAVALAGGEELRKHQPLEQLGG
jgi:hypothetical protein